MYDRSYAARITVHGDNAFLAVARCCDLDGNHRHVRIKDSAPRSTVQTSVPT